MWHQVFSFSLTQTFFYCALNTYQASTELILSELTDATNTAITQMVDVIDLAATVT